MDNRHKIMTPSADMLYQAVDGHIHIECHFEGKIVGLPQTQIAELFQTTLQNITLHLKSIYAEPDYAEDQARHHHVIYIHYCSEKLDFFLQFSEYDIFLDVGKIAKGITNMLALEQYEKFHTRHLIVEVKGYDLYLMSKFDIDQCKEIKGNAVILTNENIAYFMIEDKIVIKNEKPHAVESINRQGISSSDSTKPTKYTGSEQVKEKIIKESTLKGGHTQVKDEYTFEEALTKLPMMSEHWQADKPKKQKKS